ncbi:hypothetical protein QAD02_023335 [Eretmocerus hayati]|uniref:Uncharacterized protein n=1 Tax=Eretmocerus hayati TaxID=131215 RepID=A0ACC2PX73_9HYME|nr:hypothetical protein QAD02_023335 [Eretmocerus hayati]
MEGPEVSTADGTIRGLIRRSVENFDYHAFLGIPYAKPPIGDLRFRDPEPPERWHGIRDTTKYGNVCLQYDPMTRKFEGSEDCLYLNVYTRSIEKSKFKRPVMVWIHGGGFEFGSGSDTHFGPDYLLRKDVVLVTFNYRLYIFGFLNLEHEVAPGNQGLKDQIMVLRWIRENIENFGGDAQNITIFGESTGSVSAHYLTLSPLAKGLFHKVICQSGTGLAPWARVRNSKRYAYLACNILDEYPVKPEDAHDFLKSVDALKLMKALEKLHTNMEALHQVFAFGPGVDDKSPNPVMPIPVEEAALNGIHLPFILGYTNREGICYLLDYYTSTAHKSIAYEAVNWNFAKMLDLDTVEPFLNRYKIDLNHLRKMYYKNKKVCAANSDIFADLATDVQFVEPIHRTAKIQTEKSSQPTFLYKFCYDKDLSLMKGLLRTSMSGASHFDDVGYLFHSKQRTNLGFPNLKKGTTAYRIMEQMTELWTNFATHGLPTSGVSKLIPVEWKPLSSGSNLDCLNIDTELKMEILSNIENCFASLNHK